MYNYYTYPSDRRSPWGRGAKEIVIEEGVTSIGGYAFWDSYRLEKVSLPSSITQIGTAAFGRCPNISDIYYNGSASEYTNIYFSDKQDVFYDVEHHFSDAGNAQGHCGANISWVYENGILTISGTGKMNNYFLMKTIVAVTFLRGSTYVR